MTSTFLKRYYFDDRKLLQRTFFELVRALDSDRMIAVTGSMSTESAGYPSWKTFRTEYLGIAEDLLTNAAPGMGVPQGLLERTRGIIGGLAREYTDGPAKLDTRVALGATKETLRVLDEHRRPLPDWRLDDRWDAVASPKDPPHGMRLTGMLDARAAVSFRKPPAKTLGNGDVAERLLSDLGISRFVTLNYDFELEGATMARDARPRHPNSFDAVMSMINDGRIKRDDRVRHRLTCTLPDGTSVDSDIFDRERPDRLLEFAIGSAEADQHIFHLHGRACTPSTMVVGTRDYDHPVRDEPEEDRPSNPHRADPDQAR